jgi:hypothetical protein
MLFVATLAAFAAATAASGFWRGDLQAAAGAVAAILTPVLVMMRLGGIRACADGASKTGAALVDDVRLGPARWLAAVRAVMPTLNVGAEPALVRRLTPDSDAAGQARLVTAIGAQPGMLVLGVDTRGVLVHALVEGPRADAELAAIAAAVRPNTGPR